MKTTLDQLYPDIWQYVFEYFSAIELFSSFINITSAADEVLLNSDSRFYFRGLIVDAFVSTVPEKLPLNQVISLVIHQENCLDIIPQCSALRSLKLIGESEWIISLLTKVLCENVKLERLILIAPGVGSLHNIFESVGLIFSLRRFEIYANELEEKMQTSTVVMNQTNIEQFILHSCSSISWSDLSYMLPGLSNIRFLDITLFHENKNCFFSFTFPNLHYIRLTLLELSFESIIQVVKTTPFLTKLALNGLVDGEGFVVNHKWIYLFNLCPFLGVAIVNISLEGNKDTFRKETIQTALREINLSLRCVDDDHDYYVTGENHQRWWKLSGMIVRHHDLSGKK